MRSFFHLLTLVALLFAPLAAPAVASAEIGSPAYRVGKISFGVVMDFSITDHLSFGVGGLYSINFVPRGLKDEYGSRNPHGAMGFVRLKIR